MDTDLLTIAQELAEVTRLVEDEDVPAALERFVRRVEQTVPGCDHATITVGTEGRLETVAGASVPLLTHAAARPPTEPSPVADVLNYREPRRIGDVDTDPRWSAYGLLMKRSGFRSCLSLPLPGREEPSAAFTLFSRESERFDESTYDLVLLFTLQGGVVFDNATLYGDSRRLVEQLTGALSTRATIGQAQGLLMRRYELDPRQSFALLKGASQRRNVKLRDLAAGVVTAHTRGDLDAELTASGLVPVG